MSYDILGNHWWFTTSWTLPTDRWWR